MDNTREEEERLLEKLHLLKVAYSEQAKPIIDRIVEIRSARAPSAIVLMQQWDDAAKVNLAATIALNMAIEQPDN